MPRKSQSQSRSQRKSVNTNTSGSGGLTQTTLNFAPEEVDIEDHVNNCVRYLLQKSAHMMPFKKTEIHKNVFVKLHGRLYETIIEQATKILKEVYGYNLILSDGSTSNKIYILTTTLPYVDGMYENEEEEVPTDARKILLLLILTHIFMSNNSSSEMILKTFLTSLNIDLDRRHPLFGNLKDYLNKLIKQKYIDMEADPVSKQVTYSWGVRAENEISKMAILNFVCKVYGDRLPSSWIQHYEVAQKQDVSHNVQSQSNPRENTMEVEDDDGDDDDD